MNVPPGWSTRSIGSMFTPAQLDQVVKILNENVGTDAQTKALKPYLESIAADLMRKELVPAYLAYAIPYWASQASQNA